MKKFTMLFTSILLSLTFTTSIFAKENGSNSLIYYSDEEIQQKAIEATNQDLLNYMDSNTSLNTGGDNLISPQSSTYREWPVSYNPKTVVNSNTAFELAKVTFDSRGATSAEIELEYNSSKTITWTVSGTVSGTAEFSIIGQRVEASASTTIARESSTSNAVVAKFKRGVQLNKTGYVKIYAHGIATTGTLQYKWQDVTGRTGYINKSISSRIPYQKYDGTYIHFGPVVYN
ncbi:hypothetical protein QT711_19360 [Sporosarcina saromensis]|uniref:Toxin ETX/toxin MTX2 n=1 Tax=Sporosarcina saromensis TaxID=359365 RepID=A0ABU4GI71_9BACL|nr:hypothetical protein [Sporosarcina saromensis]MDW0115312.1 hypothetical protein [Sporosarcina saromensis]